VLLILDEMNTMRQLAMLTRQELDAAFIRPGPPDAPEPPELDIYRLPDEPMLVALPASHRLAEHERLILGELADEPMIMFPHAIGISLYNEVVTACARAGFIPRESQAAPQISSMVNLVAAGVGVSLIPASVACIQMEGVTYRPLNGDAPIARLALASRKGAGTPMVMNLRRLLTAAHDTKPKQP
jgi:DNA-binding transcriptional LysR family regulator